MPTIEVVGNTPLPGSDIDRDKVPANVQSVPSADFNHAVAPSLTDAMIRALPGVSRGDQTGNPFQPDLDYRGFTASPVAGTPEGIAVYQNGTRINEAFGDTVNWDLIPETAINGMTLSPSNPVYGFNALGGAVSIEMKNGFNYQGAEGEVRGGSLRPRRHVGAGRRQQGQRRRLHRRRRRQRQWLARFLLVVARAPPLCRRRRARRQDRVSFVLHRRRQPARLGRGDAGRDAEPELVERLHLAAEHLQSARLPAGERRLQADRHVVGAGQRLFAQFPPEPCRRQHHRRAALRRAGAPVLRRRGDAAARFRGQSASPTL